MICLAPSAGKIATSGIAAVAPSTSCFDKCTEKIISVLELHETLNYRTGMSVLYHNIDWKGKDNSAL